MGRDGTRLESRNLEESSQTEVGSHPEPRATASLDELWHGCEVLADHDESRVEITVPSGVWTDLL
jgi:hypothetical protein